LQLHVLVNVITFVTGVVLGPGGGALSSMYPAFYLGVGGPIGSGQQWFPWIHLDDLVGILIHSLQCETVSGVLNGVSPQQITNKQFASALGTALRRPAFMPLPSFVVNGVFGRERAVMLLEGQHVSPTRTIKSGYRYSKPDISSALNASV